MEEALGKIEYRMDLRIGTVNFQQSKVQHILKGSRLDIKT